MILETSTRIAPIVDVGTYGGPFSYESLWEAEEEAERSEGRLVCDDYNMKMLGGCIAGVADWVFKRERPLAKYGISRIRATEFCSPREYNFETDWLELRVTLNRRKFFSLARKAIFAPENREAIVKYAGDRWVSYDGFGSMMLNRISDLSRDAWKARHYGVHMATDPEVEAALMADLSDAFDHLEHGTGDDDFREFGAILALLWLIEYPTDYTDGSWITEELLERFRSRTSLGEFCTILEPGEAEKKLGDALIDFGGFMRSTERTYGKYIRSGVSKDSQARAKSWLETVRKSVNEWKEKQADLIEWYAPDWNRIRQDLAELRKEWDHQLNIGWPEGWK